MAAIPVVIIAMSLGSLGALRLTRGLRSSIMLILGLHLKHRSYKPGEGPLSRKYGAVGLQIDPDGDPMGQFIYHLGDHYQEMRALRGRCYGITVREGEELREIVSTVILHPAMRERRWEDLETAVKPISSFLKRYEDRVQ